MGRANQHIIETISVYIARHGQLVGRVGIPGLANENVVRIPEIDLLGRAQTAAEHNVSPTGPGTVIGRTIGTNQDVIEPIPINVPRVGDRMTREIIPVLTDELMVCITQTRWNRCPNWPRKTDRSCRHLRHSHHCHRRQSKCHRGHPRPHHPHRPQRPQRNLPCSPR